MDYKLLKVVTLQAGNAVVTSEKGNSMLPYIKSGPPKNEYGVS